MFEKFWLQLIKNFRKLRKVIVKKEGAGVKFIKYKSCKKMKLITILNKNEDKNIVKVKIFINLII